MYVTDFGNAGVSEFTVGAGGVLTAKTPSPIATGPSPEGLAETPNGQNLYVADSSKIYEYNVGAGGVLSAKSPATVSSGPSGAMAIAVSPDGQSVYVADGLNYVYQFDVGAGGQLVPKSPAKVAAGFNPYDVIVSPDGKSVYATNHGGDSVSEFDVGAGGELSPKSSPTISAGTNPYGLAITPDGDNVYVVNNGGTVSEFDVGAGGVLSAHSPATINAGTGPRQVAITPDGHSLYVTDTGGSAVSQYAIAAGTLSPGTPATVPVGPLPNGIAVGPLTATDTTPPTVSVSTPAAGAEYAQGQKVRAAFTCSDPDGAGDVASCVGTVPSGQAIDTSSPGDKTFTVLATDRAGNRGSATIHYTVLAPPALSHASESHRRWREGSRRATLARARTPVGTTFRFALNEPASVELTFKLAGRKVKGALSFHGHAGTNKVSFDGRLGGSKKLPLGAYTLTIVATNALGKRSNPTMLRFTVVAS